MAFVSGEERASVINALGSTFIVRRRALGDLRGIRDNPNVSGGACNLLQQSPHLNEKEKPWFAECRVDDTSYGDANDSDLEYTQTCGAYELVGDCWCAGTAATSKARGLWSCEEVYYKPLVRIANERACLQGQLPTSGRFKLIFC